MTEPQFYPVTEQVAQSLNELRDNIHDWAKKKGWWDKDRNKFELIALMHSELSEAVEFLRKKVKCPSDTDGDGNCPIHPQGCPSQAMDDHCPELTGEAAELADTIIRIMDYCGAYGIDIGGAVAIKQGYNIKRPYRHGGKMA